MNAIDKVYDVVVVGYGPAGMILASLLGQRGHCVAVVERWPDLYGKPRVTHIDGETARLISLAADVDQALADSWVVPHFYWTNGKGKVLLDAGLQDNTRRALWDDHISVHQPHIDTALHERIAGLSSVHLYRGFEAVTLTQEAHSVTLACRPWRRGTEVSDQAPTDIVVKGRYLVGADGSKSFIRQSLGVERIDFGFHERCLNVDAERLRPLPTKFDENAVAVCDPQRGHMFMPIGRKRQRFEWLLHPNESTEEMSTPEAAWRMLKQYHDLGPDDLKLIRNLVYTFECRLSKTWRVGRVFLAGDAAHTMPPAMGQGACSGMRDGANLAWKLDLVLRGIADEALLATYEVERVPHVTQLMKVSRSLALMANTTNKLKATFRDLMLRWVRPPPPKFPNLTDGVLARDSANRPVRAAGTVPPQGRLIVGGRTRRFDEHVGFRFALVMRAEIGRELPAALWRDLEAIGVCFIEPLGSAAAAGSVSGRAVVDCDGVYAHLLDELDADAALIRPDFVLYGHARADRLEPLLRGLLRDLHVRTAVRRAEPVAAV